MSDTDKIGQAGTIIEYHGAVLPVGMAPELHDEICDLLSFAECEGELYSATSVKIYQVVARHL